MSLVSDEQLLSIDGLETVFHLDQGTVRAVRGVSLDISAGETLGVVGESGCGKSVTALSVLRLVPSPPGKIVGGSIYFRGSNLLDLDGEGMRRIRGNEISMIFQEPMTALNPVYTVGSQIGEAIRLHQGAGKKLAREGSIDMLRQVGIPMPEKRVDEYPHQLSGGMRQRVMMAMALSCNPALLIADEPTTALDVTIQAQILELLGDLQRERNMSIMLITHDLGVIAESADRVAVMYAGEIVEYTNVRNLFHEARHPYTMGLLESMPRLHERKARLHVIPGSVPAPHQFPAGCAFSPRCPFANKTCRAFNPSLEGDRSHQVRCHRWKEVTLLRKQGVGYA